MPVPMVTTEPAVIECDFQEMSDVEEPQVGELAKSAEQVEGVGSGKDDHEAAEGKKAGRF
jgi:hypothetical protein